MLGGFHRAFFQKTTRTQKNELPVMEPPEEISTSSQQQQQQEKEQNNTIKRCAHCERKLGLIHHECKCGNLYCMQHRYEDIHKCTFDWKSMHHKQLEQKLFSESTNSKQK